MSYRVVFVDETSNIGGAEMNLIMVAPSLAADRWTPLVLMPRPGRLSARLQELGVAVDYVAQPPLISSSFYLGHRYKIPNPLALLINLFQGALWVARLCRFFRRSQPVVVHTVSMWSHAFAGLAARLAGYPVAWHFQDIVSHRSGFGLYRQLVLLWARYIPNRIICISDLVADQFRANARISGKVHVLWNTIDTTKYFSSDPLASHSTARPFTIGTVARLTPWKGHEVALAAALMLKSQGIAFRWLFAGEEALGAPGYRSRLLDLICTHGLEAEVELVGWLADMPAFYRSLDALVHVPTEPEPFGLVLAEGLAAGLPVIASAGGGADHLVELAGGMLVPARQPGPVAAALIALQSQPDELERRKLRARQFAEQQFGVGTYTQQLIGIYQSLEHR
jgi:glycosyltransferase involved in cell wall biosynthesis